MKGQVVSKLEDKKPMSTILPSVAFSTDGKRLATSGAFQPVRLWDVATGKMLREFSGQGTGVPLVAITDDGSAVVSQSWQERLFAGTRKPAKGSLPTGGDEKLLKSTADSASDRGVVLAGAVAYIRNNREITGSLVALPKGEWAAVDRYGLSYTASAGADDYLKLTKDDEVRPVD